MASSLLTARRVETSPVRGEPYKLKDGGGLFLLVRPNGSRLWRYRYRIGGLENMFAIGPYPQVSLEQARQERDTARALVRKGIHPSIDRKANLAARINSNETTFEAIARQWIAANSQWSDGYRDQVTKYLEKHVFRKSGALPIMDVRGTHIRPIIKDVADGGAKTVAILIRQWCSQIFAYAATQVPLETDPTSILKGLVKKPRVRHNPPLNWEEVPEFMKKLTEWTSGFRTTVLALQLMIYTYVRTTELRKAEWGEFNLDHAMWTIPAEKMKMRRPHLVPLPTQAVAALKELKTLTGGGKYLFPNYRRPTTFMSATTLNRALGCLGFAGRFSSHGFRSTATTLLGLLGYPDKLVDRQLAHKEKDSSRAPYDHAKFINSRRIMMQDWADIVDSLATGNSVEEVTDAFGPVSDRRNNFLKVIEREGL